MSKYLIVMISLGFLSSQIHIAAAQTPAASQDVEMKDYMSLLFRDYVKDSLRVLPAERQVALQELNLSDALNSQSETWQGAIKETLNLSDTIDIAILDLWYRNKEVFKDENGISDPDWFAEIFVQQYLKDGSKVDIWTPETLSAAKRRIETAKTLELKANGSNK